MPGTYKSPTETNLYYLKTRYYDPETGRFLSADNYDVLLARQDELLGINIYIYCDNNPISFIDPNGEILISTCVLIGLGIGALVGGVIGAIAGYNQAGLNGVPRKDRWKYVVGYGLCGVVIGGAIGALMGYGIGFLCGATSSSGIAIRSITRALSSISKNTWRHILPEKHAWSLVLKKVSIGGVKNIISKTLKNGATTLINTVISKGVKSLVFESSITYLNQTIIVRYAVIDGLLTIADAWVKTR